MVKIKGLCKSYGDFVALDHLDLSIEKGELFGFVGPNGAGKTTMMRIISGLLPADSGEVVVAGIDAIQNSVCLKEKIGYVPDFFGVYDNLKVIEYMEFYASIYGITGEDARKLCLELIDLVELTDKAEFMVDHLSRGMKQRLCLARSLVHDPDVLILDEPVSGLDPHARFEMKNTLRNLHQKGKTIIMSSHILSELAELCTTIGIIEQGRMAVKGTIEEIIRQMNVSNPILISIAGERETAIRLLKENEKVSNISIEGDMLTIGFSGDQEEQIELLQQLVANRVQVVSFYRKAGDLETVFMRVTEKREVLDS